MVTQQNFAVIDTSQMKLPSEGNNPPRVATKDTTCLFFNHYFREVHYASLQIMRPYNN